MFEVYIHVPFCMRRCGYCDFNTYTAIDMGAGASRGNYANMVIREMAIVRDWQERHGIVEPPADTVFFGGGTPTILKAADLVAMLDAVRETWGIADNAEITTEANPDTVNADYVRELADGGFNRISFGMQSAVPHVLKTLDRTHTPENVEAGISAANAAGMRSSVDLIYGAPGESLDDWRTSVNTALDLGVNHISAYALTVAPNTTMGRRIAAGMLPTPDDDDEAAKYEIADALLSAAGLDGMKSATGRVQVTNHGITSATGATSTGPDSDPGRIPITMQPPFPSEEPPGEARPMERTARRPCVPGTSHIRACGVAPSAKAGSRGLAARTSPSRRISKRPSCSVCVFERALTSHGSAMPSPKPHGVSWSMTA